jgi:hypothetical protein
VGTHLDALELMASATHIALGEVAVRLALACALCFAQLPVSALAQSGVDPVKTTQEEWVRCLKDRFPFYARKTPNQNYASDMTLQACAMYEEKLSGLMSETGVSRSAFEQLRAATKKALMAGK